MIHRNNVNMLYYIVYFTQQYQLLYIWHSVNNLICHRSVPDATNAHNLHQ